MEFYSDKGSLYNKLYGHGYNYWNYADKSGFKIKAELIAHFFEVIGSGGNRLRTFETVFPCLYIYLLNKIR